MITVFTKINKPISLIWKCWTQPEHIVNWYFACKDCYCPDAKNDLTENGNFSFRMSSRDGTFSFNFTGTYQKIVTNKLIEYKISDERNVIISFSETNGLTEIIEKFDPENKNPHDFQKKYWQEILDNFKKYVEGI